MNYVFDYYFDFFFIESKSAEIMTIGAWISPEKTYLRMVELQYFIKIYKERERVEWKWERETRNMNKSISKEAKC